MVFDLTTFEKEYKVLEKKYGLPSFQKVNEDFEIDKIDRETKCLLRLIRKVIMEKIVNSIQFLEMLINPVNTPRIYLSYIHSMTSEDRKEIERIYTALGKLSIVSLDVEIYYIEKKEAELIKQAYESWQLLKPGFRMILKHMIKPEGNNNSIKKEKSYFG